MKIHEISNINFKASNTAEHKNKREFIDVIVDNVSNPRDVKDCVAVPRGIFKAYILLMAGSSVMLAAAALPQKWKVTKTILNIGSAVLTAASALYFAKPFAFKGLAPTVTREEVAKNNTYDK